MYSFKAFLILTEGIHDKGLFKAVFLAGGPGSGKDFVKKEVLEGHGLKEINSDIPFEYYLRKRNLSLTMPDNEKQERDTVRDQAVRLSEPLNHYSVRNRHGIIINGTGANPEHVQHIKNHLESLGYSNHMVMVNTDNDTSRQRNIMRGQAGGRSVPENIRQNKWNEVQSAKEKYKDMFGQNYNEVNNS